MKSGGIGGAHSHSDVTPFEEYLEAELKRRAEWTARPENAARERGHLNWAEMQRQQKRLGKGKVKSHELYGPPNPYKPHRKQDAHES